MTKYIKKPVEIEAVLYTGSNHTECLDFLGKDFAGSGAFCIKLLIKTLEGVLAASPGDYIIRGIEGEHYPCKPDIFKKTYYTEEEYAQLEGKS